VSRALWSGNGAELIAAFCSLSIVKSRKVWSVKVISSELGQFLAKQALTWVAKHVWGDDLYVTVEHDEAKEYCELREVTLIQNDAFGMAGGLAQVLEHEGQFSWSAWHDDDPNACLWRAVLVKYTGRTDKFTLVLAFHHLITDGMGAVAVCQAIVEASGIAIGVTSDKVTNAVRLGFTAANGRCAGYCSASPSSTSTRLVGLISKSHDHFTPASLSRHGS